MSGLRFKVLGLGFAVSYRASSDDWMSRTLQVHGCMRGAAMPGL